MTDKAQTTQVYKVYIKASPEAIWTAITSPEWSDRYGYGGRVEFNLKPGGKFVHHASDMMKSMGMIDEMIVGEVIEADPPRRLVCTWHPLWSEESKAEKPTRVTYEIRQNRTAPAR